MYDVGGGLGGPLKRDRAWFFAAGRKWGAEERVAGLYFNKLLPDSLFYEPDMARPAIAPNNQYDTSIKVNRAGFVGGPLTRLPVEQSAVQMRLLHFPRRDGPQRRRRANARGDESQQRAMAR